MNKNAVLYNALLYRGGGGGNAVLYNAFFRGGGGGGGNVVLYNIPI